MLLRHLDIMGFIFGFNDSFDYAVVALFLLACLALLHKMDGVVIDTACIFKVVKNLGYLGLLTCFIAAWILAVVTITERVERKKRSF